MIGAAIGSVPADAWIAGLGSAALAGMLGYLIRPVRTVVDLGASELIVGTRRVPWSSVRRMRYWRRRGRGAFELDAEGGVLSFTSDEIGQSAPELYRDRIAERCGLARSDLAGAPRGLGSSSAEIHEEWAQPATPPLPSAPAESRRRAARTKRRAAAALAFLAILWKLGKWALVALKFGVKALKLGKLAPTALTMVGTIWVYAQTWGWRFALGFVLLIFLHEMGHAVVIRAKGLRTSAIVFIPFFGAFLNIKDQIRDAAVEADMAYGGPAAGALAASACFLAYRLGASEFWLHLAYSGFFLNLFNLIPVSPLDGGRVVAVVSTWLWIPGLVVAGALAFMTLNVLLIVIAAIGLGRAWTEWRARRRGESRRYYQVPGGYRALMAAAYFGLAAYLGYMSFHALRLGGAV